MPGKRWANDTQLALVQSYLPAYQQALRGPKKRMKDFWPKLEAGWFAANPMKDELVKLRLLPEIVLEDGHEIQKDSEEEKTYKKALEKRAEQLKTLLRYEHKQAVAKAGIVDPGRASLSAVAKSFVKAQRRCAQPQEMYYRLFQSEVNAIFEKEKDDYVDEVAKAKEDVDAVDVAGAGEEEGDGDGDGEDLKQSGRRRGWNLRLRRRIVSQEWEKATPERKALVMEEIEKERAQMALEADLEESGKGLARPLELRKGSMQRINAFWGSNAQLCWDNAAMMSIQIGVAPDPSDGDKLVTMCISYGLDQNGKVFQDIFPNFQEVFVKPVLNWAKNNVFHPAAWEKARNQAEKACSDRLPKPEDDLSRETAAVRDSGSAKGPDSGSKNQVNGHKDGDKGDDNDDDDDNDNDNDDNYDNDDDNTNNNGDNDPVLGDLNMHRSNSPHEEHDQGFDITHGLLSMDDAEESDGGGQGGGPGVRGVAPSEGVPGGIVNDAIPSVRSAALHPPSVPNPAVNDLHAPNTVPNGSHPPLINPPNAASSIFKAGNLPRMFSSVGSLGSNPFSSSSYGPTTASTSPDHAMQGLLGSITAPYLPPQSFGQAPTVSNSFTIHAAHASQPHDPNTGPNESMEIGLQRALGIEPTPSPFQTQGVQAIGFSDSHLLPLPNSNLSRTTNTFPLDPALFDQAPLSHASAPGSSRAAHTILSLIGAAPATAPTTTTAHFSPRRPHSTSTAPTTTSSINSTATAVSAPAIIPPPPVDRPSAAVSASPSIIAPTNTASTTTSTPSSATRHSGPTPTEHAIALPTTPTVSIPSTTAINAASALTSTTSSGTGPTATAGSIPTPPPTTSTTDSAPVKASWTSAIETNIPPPQPKQSKKTSNPSKGAKKGAKGKKGPSVAPPAEESASAKKRKAPQKDGDAGERSAKVAKVVAEPSELSENAEDGRPKRSRQPAKRFDGGGYVEVTTTSAKPVRQATAKAKKTKK